MTPDPTRSFLRHALATMAYRGAKTLRDAPAQFARFRVQPGARTPLEILAHMGDLFDWALSMAKGSPAWHDSAPLEWTREVERFYAAVKAFDDYLADSQPIACPVDRLFQGPIADAITHVGQLAMLRHLCGAPMRGENYFVAEIKVGQVGEEQAAPVRLFE